MKNISDKKITSRSQAGERHPAGTEDGILAGVTSFGMQIHGGNVMQEALGESELILRSFFDSPGVMRGIVEVIAEDDMRHIVDNTAAASFLGLTPDAMRNRRSSELGIPENVRRMLAGRYRESRKNRKPVTFEYRYRRRGEEYSFLFTLSYLGTPPRGSPRFAYVIIDVTESRRAETALRESEERMRFALETSHTGAWELDLSDHTSSRSPDHDRIFGYEQPLPEWTYEMFLDHVIPEDRPGVDAKFRHAVENGTDWNFECRIRRPDGEIRWIWAAGRHRPCNDGTTRMAGIVQDITGRKCAEEELHEARDTLELRVEERTRELKKAVQDLSTERLRLYDVLEGLPVYVCLLDKDYRMPFANKYFRESFREPEGRRCYEFLFDRTEPCETCESYTVMRTKAPHHWYWTGPNGRDYDIYDFPFTDTDGSFMILEMGIDITERKKAEDELAILASIVEHTEDAIIGKTLSGIIMSWNAAAARMYGYSPGEAIGRNVSMLQPPGHEDDLKGILESIRKGKPVHHYETVRMRKDGSLITVSLTISPIRDRQGVMIGASTIARDITKWKEAEDATRKANAYNRSLIEASLDPLVTISPAGTISDVNEATVRVTGFPREDLIGTDFSDYFTDPARAKAAYKKAFRDGAIMDYALEIRHRDGNVTPVLYNAGVLRDGSGKIAGVFAAARDITERFRAEEELRKSCETMEKRVKERTAELGRTNTALQTEIDERKGMEDALRETSQYLENLINYASAPIVVWDPQFCITRFNHAFERLTGLTSGEVIGKTPDILIPKKFRHQAMDLIRKTAGGKRWEAVEIPILHKNGDVRIVLWNSAILYDKTCKNVVATIAQGQDITDRKRAEEAIRLSEARERAQLEELTKVLDAVPAAVWISHDSKAQVITGNHLSHQWLNVKDGVNMSASAPSGERLVTFRAFKDGRELLPEEMPVQMSAAGAEVRNYEFNIVYPDGGMRHVLGNAMPLMDEEGNPRGSVSAFIDISDRLQAEETTLSEKKKAEETLSLLNAALESTADGILVVDTDRKITSFNQTFTSLWKIDQPDLLKGDDQNLLMFLQQQAKDPCAFLDRILDLYRYPARESSDMVELADGRIFERYSKPQKMGDAIIGRVWSYRDVTDRRHAEEKLLASLQEKETLIREIHHRVKNNLQIISGLLDMTRMRTPDSRTSGILTDMMLKIKTMAQIHTRLYESKQFDRINMALQIRDQVTDLSVIYGRSGAVIDCEIDAEDIFLPVDQAIPCALIVNEILSNAFKHAFRGRKQGMLSVSAKMTGGRVRITVKDDGIGIPPDVDLTKATSLGLKLIRSLILQLNGSVALTSDRGTEMTVEFPPGGGGT